MILNLILPLVLTTYSFTGDLNLTFDYTVFKNNDSTYSLNYYYVIPYTKLFFLKSGNVFSGKYQFALQVWKKHELIAGKIFTREIFTGKYDDTKLQNHFHLDSLNINFSNTIPNIDKFTANIQVNDLNSKNTGNTQFDFNLPEFFSRMTFFKNHELNPARTYSNEQNKSETLQIFLNIYTETVKYCSLWIDKIATQKSRDQIHSKTEAESQFSNFRKFIPIKEETLDLSSVFVIQTVDFTYPLTNLVGIGSGQYKITASGYDINNKKVFQTAEMFSIESSFLYSEGEYLEMVNRLIYIATESEMRNLKQTEPSRRESTWNVFWKQYDPTPTTEINEAEDEYFTRIDYCIKHFSKSDKGYKSDRAKVYMKYGLPDYIESRPFERYSNAYEIWYYYDIGKQFTFSDSHGFGELILYEERKL